MWAALISGTETFIQGNTGSQEQGSGYILRFRLTKRS